MLYLIYYGYCIYYIYIICNYITIFIICYSVKDIRTGSVILENKSYFSCIEIKSLEHSLWDTKSKSACSS